MGLGYSALHAAKLRLGSQPIPRDWAIIRRVLVPTTISVHEDKVKYRHKSMGANRLRIRSAATRPLQNAGCVRSVKTINVNTWWAFRLGPSHLLVVKYLAESCCESESPHIKQITLYCVGEQ